MANNRANKLPEYNPYGYYVKAYEVKKGGTLVVVIPKPIRERLKIEKGALLNVRADSKGRVIYRPIPRGSER